MTTRIGARKCDSVYVVCLSPNICWTPAGNSKKQVPYMIHVDLSQSMNVVPNVKFNGRPAFVFDEDSYIPRVEGNEPGVGDGANSSGIDERGNGDGTTGINQGIVRPIEAAPHVRAGGRRVVREFDLCAMNLKE